MRNQGLEVDKVEIKVIEHLLLLINLKQHRGFRDHIGFNRRFIKDLNKMHKYLTNLSSKGVKY